MPETPSAPGYVPGRTAPSNGGVNLAVAIEAAMEANSSPSAVSSAAPPNRPAREALPTANSGASASLPRPRVASTSDQAQAAPVAEFAVSGRASRSTTVDATAAAGHHAIAVGLSMRAALRHSYAVPRNPEELFAQAENPRRDPSLGDLAELWWKPNGEVVVARFPCELDMGQQSATKFSPHFDHYPSSGPITEASLVKVRAAFPLRSLTQDKSIYPEDVLAVGANSLKAMSMIQKKHEGTKTAVRRDGKVREFYESNSATNRFEFVVKTNPLFTLADDPADMVDSNDFNINDAPAEDLFASPSKRRAYMEAASLTAASAARKSNPSAPFYLVYDVWIDCGALGMMTLREFVDTLPPGEKTTEMYTEFVGNRHYLWNSTVNVPEVRDQNGVLVKPHEYSTKLQHGAPATVDVIFRYTELGKGASRFYTMILQRMQLHPLGTLSEGPVDKGKRQASPDSDNEGEGDHLFTPTPSPTKKRRQ
ncbi:hypothetical protein NP233_g10709 [Leucocoprinus birnbaumii]|uniref:Uncharacterized protein n=1 Tax=Leucocoprinus birnbaumii TaxID=56174 RepID=A0AAD5VNS9_9AGAR|nr:hypothetical protein NP233_g10709 [Leucocoprinus birnbaumii]